MKDGLYRVSYRNICAGFEIENGKLKSCAPVLRKRFEYWKRHAKRMKEVITVAFKT